MTHWPQHLPEHSPLGGSAASRYITCPGSVSLSHGVDDPESEYAAAGTAAHSIAEICLLEGGDAWQFIGRICQTRLPKAGKVTELKDDPTAIVADKEMADAVQDYLIAVRNAHPKRNQHNSFVERAFYCPSIHKYFYGKADFVHIDDAARVVHVWDYKHGAGIVVDVKNNPQCMYYAIGVLEEFDLWNKVDTVVLHIAQPRGFHFDGPIREWAITVDDLEDWLNETLLPAMDKAMVSRNTQSGEHCRFCPARRHACPQIVKDFDELEALMKEIEAQGGAPKATNEQVARFLHLHDVAKVVRKAMEETAFHRLQRDANSIPGRKLAHARTNREWKDDAEKALKKKFGKDAYTQPELKSPAKIDALPEGNKYTARYAFKPQGKLTVVAATDARAPVKKDMKSMFKKQKKGKK